MSAGDLDNKPRVLATAVVGPVESRTLDDMPLSEWALYSALSAARDDAMDSGDVTPNPSHPFNPIKYASVPPHASNHVVQPACPPKTLGLPTPPVSPGRSSSCQTWSTSGDGVEDPSVARESGGGKPLLPSGTGRAVAANSFMCLCGAVFTSSKQFFVHCRCCKNSKIRRTASASPSAASEGSVVIPPVGNVLNDHGQSHDLFPLTFHTLAEKRASTLHDIARLVSRSMAESDAPGDAGIGQDQRIEGDVLAAAVSLVHQYTAHTSRCARTSGKSKVLCRRPPKAGDDLSDVVRFHGFAAEEVNAGEHGTPFLPFSRTALVASMHVVRAEQHNYRYAPLPTSDTVNIPGPTAWRSSCWNDPQTCGGPSGGFLEAPGAKRYVPLRGGLMRASRLHISGTYEPRGAFCVTAGAANDRLYIALNPASDISEYVDKRLAPARPAREMKFRDSIPVPIMRRKAVASAGEPLASLDPQEGGASTGPSDSPPITCLPQTTARRPPPIVLAPSSAVAADANARVDALGNDVEILVCSQAISETQLTYSPCAGELPNAPGSPADVNAGMRGSRQRARSGSPPTYTFRHCRRGSTHRLRDDSDLPSPREAATSPCGDGIAGKSHGRSTTSAHLPLLRPLFEWCHSGVAWL